MKNFNLLILVACLILVFVACNDDNSEKTEENYYKEKFELLSEENKTQDNKINEFKSRVDSMKVFEDSLDILKTKLKASKRAGTEDNEAMQRYLDNINRLMKKNEELASQLKDEIKPGAGTNSIIDLLFQNIETKQEQIAYLNTEITVLNEEVKGLKTTVHNQTKIIYNKEKDIADAMNENSNLTDENNELKEKDKVLTGYISNTFLNAKNEVVAKPKRTNLEYIRVKYTIKANENAETGSQNIYVRMELQNQSKIEVLSNNYRTFKDYNGKEITYTELATITYNGKELTDYINWKVAPYKLNSGTYLVTLYSSDGHIIGKDEFVLDFMIK